MPNCTSCGQHYRLSAYNQTEYCEECIDEGALFGTLDSEIEVDVMQITNPSGKTPARFLDEDDSHGF